jgi:hypothetical protein
MELLPGVADRVNFMEAAIDRIMLNYDPPVNRSAAASADARARVTDYLTTLFEAGPAKRICIG